MNGEQCVDFECLIDKPENMKNKYICKPEYMKNKYIDKSECVKNK